MINDQVAQLLTRSGVVPPIMLIDYTDGNANDISGNNHPTTVSGAPVFTATGLDLGSANATKNVTGSIVSGEPGWFVDAFDPMTLRVDFKLNTLPAVGQEYNLADIIACVFDGVFKFKRFRIGLVNIAGSFFWATAFQTAPSQTLTAATVAAGNTFQFAASTDGANIDVMLDGASLNTYSRAPVISNGEIDWWAVGSTGDPIFFSSVVLIKSVVWNKFLNANEVFKL